MKLSASETLWKKAWYQTKTSLSFWSTLRTCFRRHFMLTESAKRFLKVKKLGLQLWSKILTRKIKRLKLHGLVTICRKSYLCKKWQFWNQSRLLTSLLVLPATQSVLPTECGMRLLLSDSWPKKKHWNSQQLTFDPSLDLWCDIKPLDSNKQCLWTMFAWQSNKNMKTLNLKLAKKRNLGKPK